MVCFSKASTDGPVALKEIKTADFAWQTTVVALHPIFLQGSDERRTSFKPHVCSKSALTLAGLPYYLCELRPGARLFCLAKKKCRCLAERVGSLVEIGRA